MHVYRVRTTIATHARTRVAKRTTFSLSIRVVIQLLNVRDLRFVSFHS